MKPKKTKRKPSKPFQKGRKKTAGRKLGTPNVVTVEVKRAISLAFEGIGGVGSLTAWAKKNPALFYTKVWVKLLPHKITVEGDIDVEHRIPVRDLPVEVLRQMADMLRKKREEPKVVEALPVPAESESE